MDPTIVRFVATWTSWVVSWSVVAWLFVKRDATSLILVCGAILNGLLAKLLKYSFSVPRPAGSRLSTHGWPSSHAMSLFFFAAALSGSSFTTTFLLLISGALSAARVYDGVHTMEQVVAGALFGFVHGMFWRKIGIVVLEPRVMSFLLSLGIQHPESDIRFLAIIVLVAIVGAVGTGAASKIWQYRVDDFRDE